MTIVTSSGQLVDCESASTSYEPKPFFDAGSLFSRDLAETKLKFLTQPLYTFLRKYLREKEINDFLENNLYLEGVDFIDHIFDYFNFSYSVSNLDRQRIPATGKLLIVANHPLGCLDGLALLRMVKEVRPDVKVFANEYLLRVPQIKSAMLPIDNQRVSNSLKHKSLRTVLETLQNEEAVIVFPAGVVSRFNWIGVMDKKWKEGFVCMAEKTCAPILPVHIQGRNSFSYYTLSLLADPLGLILLPNEMFKQFNTEVKIRVGDLIPYNDIKPCNKNERGKVAKAVQKKVYALPRLVKTKVKNSQKSVSATTEPILTPGDVRCLNRELQASELIGRIGDKKFVYLFDAFPGSFVMRELGRLREISFRMVGEGTGKKIDLDAYDMMYRHLIVWDEEDLEIMGSYRLGEPSKLPLTADFSGIYSATLFDYKEPMFEIVQNGLELGRSFLQPKYWKRRGLDYLWMGIGAFLSKRPNIRYLFGPVSISGAFPQQAKDLLVGYYQTYYRFDSEGFYAVAKNKYSCPESTLKHINETYPKDIDMAFKALKKDLQVLGVSVPTLYKQYVDLSDPVGIQFLDFGLDPDFNNSIDGLIVVDLLHVKESKKLKYKYSL